MRPALLKAAGAVLMLGLAAATAHAGRPLATEDADVLARGDCELEGFVARLATSGEPAERGSALQVGCGIGLRTQAAVAASQSRVAGERTTTWALVGKTSLVERKDDGIGLTLAWGVDAQRSSGRSSRHENSALVLVATRAWPGDWVTHANLGWSRSESAAANTTTWNVAAEHALGSVDLMAELYGNDRERAWLGVGARWSIAKDVSVNASWAVQDSTPRARLGTVGFKIGF